MSSNSNEFEFKTATRERVPLLIGLVGPSGSGKTFSALRLATGIQRVTGGDIFYIDTEARRALHYADRFTFKHCRFHGPFSPARYLAVCEAAVKAGAKTIVIDSLSHEHEGAGGVMEMHEAELDRLTRGDDSRRESMKFLAWAKPKAERRKLINTLLQFEANVIACFRAKEKIKLMKRKERRPGEDPVQQLGWMPIAGEEFVYEMTLNMLLYPNCGGIPSWHSEEMGEKAIIKLPVQFKSIFEKEEPLSEDIGAKLAEWAAGGAKPAPSAVPSVTINDVSRTEKDGKTVYLVTSSAGTYATMDDSLAAVASSLVGKPARVSATQTTRGGWKLTAIEPVEEAA